MHTPNSLFKNIRITLLLLFIIFSLDHNSPTPATCSSFSCNHHRRGTIQVPFRVAQNQIRRCGYPGFELTCQNNETTLIKLPSSPDHPYIVFAIDYVDQLLWLSDPDGCIPNRLLNFNLTGSPYGPGPTKTEYTFMNCSKPVKDTDQLPAGATAVTCLSGVDHAVVMTVEEGAKERLESREWECRVVKTVEGPLWWRGLEFGYYPEDMSDVWLQLSWDVPGCGDCALRGGSCGFVADYGLAVGCSPSSGNNIGLPRSAEIGVILGVGIPGVICMILFTFYISSRVGRCNQNQRHPITDTSPTIFPQPTIVTMGIDRPTIESYPKTILGESKRLPKPSDGTCPICLSEYQPKETLRSIPECNHYFHVECIDEWLRMNSTCPLCRNSPQMSSAPAAG